MLRSEWLVANVMSLGLSRTEHVLLIKIYHVNPHLAWLYLHLCIQTSRVELDQTIYEGDMWSDYYFTRIKNDIYSLQS